MNFKNTIRLMLALAATVVSTVHANPVQMLVNGGFESGNLNGWSAAATANGTISVCCDNRWGNLGTGVSANGTGGLSRLAGNYSVFGDFDGGTSINADFNKTDVVDFSLKQAVLKSGYYASAIVSFDFQVQGGQSAQYYSDRPGGLLERTFTASLTGANGSTIFYTYTVPDWNNNAVHAVQHVSIDIAGLLNAQADGLVNLSFDRLVPQYFTAPGTFVADNFSLLATAGQAVPEPAAPALILLGLMALGLVRRRT
jgi:hypothetical protein